MSKHSDEHLAFSECDMCGRFGQLEEGMCEYCYEAYTSEDAHNDYRNQCMQEIM